VRDTEIIDHEAFMTVYWTNGKSIREESYTDNVIDDLLAEARRLRGETTGQPRGERGELLRTLGEILDSDGISFNGIVEKNDSFVVSGIAQGRYVNHWYPREDLRALSRERRPHRAPPPPPEVPATPAGRESRWPLLRWKHRM